MVPGGRHADGVHVVLNGCVENRLHHVAVTNDDLIVRMTQFRRGASDVDELDKPDSSKEKGRSGAELRESMGHGSASKHSSQARLTAKLNRIFMAFLVSGLRVCRTGTSAHTLCRGFRWGDIVLYVSATGDVAPPRLGVWGFWSVPPWCRLLDSGASLWRK